MRVAGTVIWSTDLIEMRSTDGGGKGAPDMVRYSYSASFAVLLSARPIRGVRRIWADGKLLRGAAGDFKSRTGFRLHLGNERQGPDPLIASAVGIDRATAMRGQAYAVFEGMALADYCNRIPSLTFEVEADAGPVDAGAIARAVGGGAVAASEALSPVLAGFSAHGGSRRGVLETLATTTGAWFAPESGALFMRGGAGEAAAIEDAGVGGRRGVRTIAAIDHAPRAVTIGHYDAARDYQAGLQRAIRPGPGMRERHEELPAVLSAQAAKQVAAAMLVRAEADRWRRRVSMGWAALSIAPGDRVRVAGDPTLWRVAGWRLESMAIELELAPIALATASSEASPGAVVGAPDRPLGRTLLVAAELPPLDDALPARSQLTVVAAGSAPGWRGATLMLSEDGGASWRAAASLRAPGVIGSVIGAPGPAVAAIEDRTNAIVVDLAHANMALVGASDAALDAGANLALVGDELIQFGGAEQIGPRRWRLTRLWRGRRGTERAMATHVAGERFALIERDGAVTLPVGAAIGGIVTLGAVGAGDGDVIVPLDVPITGASVLPPPPVHARVVAGAEGVRLEWVRRSRSGWRWDDHVDAPLAEESEQYRIRIIREDGGEAIRTAGAAPLVLPPEEATFANAEVAQIGTHGASAAVPFE